MPIQELREDTLDAVEALASWAIVCEQIVRVVAHYLGVEWRNIGDLDALLKRIQALTQEEAAQADGPGPQSPRP